MKNRQSHILFSLLLGAAVLFTAIGCDSTDADDSDFEFLEGSWQVERVQQNGSQYELNFDRASLTFLERSSTGERRFVLRGRNDGETEEIEGNVELFSGDELLLISNGFERGTEVRLSYVIDTSDRLVLRTTSVGGDNLLLFLTGIDFGDDVRGVEAVVTRDQQAGS